MPFLKRKQAEPARTDKSELTPKTVDRENRTVEVVFSTGAKRQMYHKGEVIYESLEVSEKAIRADRLNKGISVLDAHWSWSIGDVLGHVIPGSFRIEDGSAICTIQFANNERGLNALQGVADGTLRFVSVGYLTYKYEEQATDDGVRHLKAIDWEPNEISLVPIPADAGAQFRNNGPLTPTSYPEPEIIKTKGRKMDEEEKVNSEPQKEIIEAPNKEQQRDNSAEIVEICAIAGLDIHAARGYIADNKSSQQVRADILSRKEAATSEVIAVEPPATIELPEVLTPKARDIFNNLNKESK